MSRSLGSIAWNLTLEAELVRVLTVLDPVEAVVFKGPLLTRQLYGDLGARISSDNDLLIRSEDAGQALRALARDGYHPLPFDVAESTLAAQGRVTLLKNASSVVHTVDLHVAAFANSLFRVSAELVRAHLEPVALHGRTLLRFDKKLAFAHLVAHFVQHRFDDRILKDLGQAWTRWQDVLRGESFREFAERTCTLEAFEYAISAAHALGLTLGPKIAATCPRTRFVLRAFPPERIFEPIYLGYVRALWSTLLVRPTAMPKLAWRGVVLPARELAVRQQRPYEPWMRLERLRAPFDELFARLREAQLP
ncbi:MAG TPA: nucleotidyltransferase family protein [Polyangiaceae bacterium]|nr:nucleotidyltransferase family protein [Polyangiaceae bacterium]